MSKITAPNLVTGNSLSQERPAALPPALTGRIKH
jgi:hypothetical protein